MKTKNFLMILTIAGILISGCSPMSQAQEEREKRFLSSPQYKDGSFANPIKVPLIAPGATWKLIKKYAVIPRQYPRPTGLLPIEPLRSEDWIDLKTQGIFFSWLGHSSLLIALEGKTILVDPVLEERASPFTWIGPKRFHPSPLAVKDLFPIDVVLITHDHYDHLEEPTIKKLAGKTNLFLVPLGIGELLEKWVLLPGRSSNWIGGNIISWALCSLPPRRRSIMQVEEFSTATKGCGALGRCKV